MSPVQTDAGQPEPDVVRPGDGLVLVAEPLDGDDRPEHLVLDDLAVLRRAGDDRRLEVGARADRGDGRRSRSRLRRTRGRHA